MENREIPMFFPMEVMITYHRLQAVTGRLNKIMVFIVLYNAFTPTRNPQDLSMHCSQWRIYALTK